jgi:hypothetical protein
MVSIILPEMHESHHDLSSMAQLAAFVMDLFMMIIIVVVSGVKLYAFEIELSLDFSIAYGRVVRKEHWAGSFSYKVSCWADPRLLLRDAHLKDTAGSVVFVSMSILNLWTAINYLR